MKKFLFPILIAVLLSSCGKTAPTSSQESKETEDNSIASISSSEEETTSSNETISSSNEESLSSSEETVTSSSEQTPVGVSKKTVTFYNGGFTGSLDLTVTQTNFVNWFNGDNPILDSVGLDGYAQVNYIGNEGESTRFSTLTLGSQSKTGALSFNFNVDVTYVKVTVQAYSKYIAYTDTWNVDKHSTILINNVNHNLYLADDHEGPAEEKEFDCGFTGGTKTVTLANKEEGQRVFVHSMEITYWG